MAGCPVCGGCENTGTQPCPACQPQAGGHERRSCEICLYDREDCHACDGIGDDGYDPWGCPSCGGSGVVTPDHCCACGGSPYCTCCPACGAECIGECRCPVTVQRADGSTITLGAASSGEVPGGEG
jgi:hypothetical protein